MAINSENDSLTVGVDIPHVIEVFGRPMCPCGKPARRARVRTGRLMIFYSSEIHAWGIHAYMPDKEKGPAMIADIDKDIFCLLCACKQPDFARMAKIELAARQANIEGAGGL